MNTIPCTDSEEDEMDLLSQKMEELNQYQNSYHEYCRSMEDGQQNTNSKNVPMNLMCKKCSAVGHLTSKCPLILNTVRERHVYAIQEMLLANDEETKLHGIIPPHYTKKDMSNLQKDDDDLGTVHEWFDQKQMPGIDEINHYSPALKKYCCNISNIVREDGVLYQKKYASTNELNYQLLVPADIQDEIIYSNHWLTETCHLGTNKTSKKTRQKFYWYRMDKDIRDYIRLCSTCNQHKPPVRRSEMSRVITSGKSGKEMKDLRLKKIQEDHRTRHARNPRVETLKKCVKSALTSDNNHGQTKSLRQRSTEMGHPAEADDLCN